ncbi:MAG: hypothetical protein WCS01_08140 [bacterium]
MLVVITGFILWHLSPLDLLRDTTTVGGDTPAHNYLASHLREQLFGHGRFISWAGGWWCGFPMFQFYFCLPYVLIALLSVALPFNIAFKLVSVLGLVALPASAYVAARLWRFPRPVPLLLAAGMVPFLFTRVHTMWGVNVSSTLAGMIANSLSFALMLPAIAAAYRDTEEGRFRLRTVLLLVLVMASHFFTSVMAGVALAAAPVIVALRNDGHGGRGRRLLSGIRLMAMEGGLALLLMAWWWVPLVAKSEFSMEFGVNWGMTLWKNFPGYTAALIPLAVVAGVLGLRRQVYGVWLLVWMLAASLALFYFGFGVSPVFVNVRLWPFIFFAIVALGAVGVGLFLEGRRRQEWAVAGIVVAALAGAVLEDHVPGDPGVSLSRAWSAWNFAGLEIKPSGGVFDDLVLPLEGTPGRLANDLCEENNQLGSSRIFELAPHLAGKPILEGGLVNSGFGSMFSYYIQGESSPTCAGYPPMVVPATFNFTNATRHLELFNVKHFIARSEATRNALRHDSRWRFIQREEEWELYELMSHDGHYVVIPRFQPVVVETTRWKECSLEWLYTMAAIDQPFLFIPPGEGSEGAPAGPRLSEAEFRKTMAGLRDPGSNAQRPTTHNPQTIAVASGRIWDEVVTDDRIAFKTDALGAPHIIKCSYFPNWKVKGAKKVFMVSPAFMLVFPEQEQVELFYGSTWSDGLGRGLTVLGACLAGVAGWRKRAAKGS